MNKEIIEAVAKAIRDNMVAQNPMLELSEPGETIGVQDNYDARFYDCEELAVTALSTIPQPVTVADGWQLVPKEPTFEMAKAAIHLDPKSDLDAKYRAMLAAAPTPPSPAVAVKPERGLKHPHYAHGISTEELMREAIAFCDEELDAYEGMEYDDDCEVCCQRSNTFIRELAHRLAVGSAARPLDPETEQKLREALRFAASRSVMSAEHEQRILSALASPPSYEALREENERLLKSDVERTKTISKLFHERDEARDALASAEAKIAKLEAALKSVKDYAQSNRQWLIVNNIDSMLTEANQ